MNCYLILVGTFFISLFESLLEKSKPLSEIDIISDSLSLGLGF